MIRKTKFSAALPAAGEGPRGPDGHLAYLLRQAAAAVRTGVERALTDLGVTHPQFVALTMIGAYPGLSNADLARVALLTPQTVSAIVANLKRAGRVASVPHPVHGRIRQLELTAAGREVLAACRARVEQFERRLAAGLAPAEERALRAWLARTAIAA